MKVTKEGVEELERVGEGRLRSPRAGARAEVAAEEGIVREGVAGEPEWRPSGTAASIWLLGRRWPNAVFVVQLKMEIVEVNGDWFWHYRVCYVPCGSLDCSGPRRHC